MRLPRRRGGFVLPLVLLLLPALLALALAAFHLAHGQWTVTGLDTRLLEELAAAHPPPSRVPAPGETAWRLAPGGPGDGDYMADGGGGGAFFLLRAPPGPLGGERRGHRVVWLPHAASLALTWTLQVEGPPRFGPLPVEVLLARLPARAGAWESGGNPDPSGDSSGEWLLPGGHHVRAPGGWLSPVGEDGILLLAPGAVVITGFGPLPAAVLAAGEVMLLGEVELQGGIRTPRGLRMDPGSHFVPDPAWVHAALLHPHLDRLHLLPGGERLGRF